MKKFLLITVLGFAICINNAYAQSSKEKPKKEVSKEDEKTKEKKSDKNKKMSSDEKNERVKEDFRKFGRSQRDFWKGVHERKVANKEAKDRGEKVERKTSSKQKDKKEADKKKEDAPKSSSKKEKD